MITLYKYTHHSRAETVVWALNELGLEYETKELNAYKLEQRSKEFLAINPYGKIPAITHNGKNFTESLAIIEYLNDLHPEKPLTPNVNDANYAEKNYKLRQVISFGMIEIESYLWILTNDLHPEKPLTPNVNDANYAEKNYKLRQVISFGMIEIESYLWILTKIKVLGNFENWPKGTAENCIQCISNALPIASEWLVSQDYIAGDSFTLADIYYHHLFSWLKTLGVELPEQVKPYVKRLAERDKFPKK